MGKGQARQLNCYATIECDIGAVSTTVLRGPTDFGGRSRKIASAIYFPSHRTMRFAFRRFSNALLKSS